MISALRARIRHRERVGVFLFLFASVLASVRLKGQEKTLLPTWTTSSSAIGAASDTASRRAATMLTQTKNIEDRRHTGAGSQSSTTASVSVNGGTAQYRRLSELRCERSFAVDGKAQFSCYMKHACVSFPRQPKYGAPPLNPPYVAKVTLFGEEELLAKAGLAEGIIYAVDPVQSTNGDYSAGVLYKVSNVGAWQPLLNDIQDQTTLNQIEENDMSREWPIEQKGAFTLASYFGAGNWGHMLADNFFGIWTRFRFLSRNLHDASFKSSTKASRNDAHVKRTVLVMRNCTTAHPMNLAHTAHLAVPACERHVQVLSRALGIESRALAQGETTCYEHLVVGSPDHLARILHANASDVEGYRDHIIRNTGRNPEQKSLKNMAVLVTKRSEDSYSFYDFANQDKLLDVLRSSHGADNVRLYVITPNTTLEEQIDVFLNASTLVCPGGGVGFSSFFLAKGSHLIIWPYPGGGHEEKQFSLSAKWLRKVDLWVPEIDPVQNLNPSGPLPHFVYKSKYPIARIKKLLDEAGR